MVSSSSLIITVFLCFSFAATSLSRSDGDHDRGTYIIHMDKSAMPSSFPTPHDWYSSILSSTSDDDEDEESHPIIHLYTYNHVMNGFSAVLSKAQLDKLERTPGHIASFPESFGGRHTTHTLDFLGLNTHAGLWPAGKFGDDVIIGVLDSGVWPESESFSDAIMPPVPTRWRGTCEATGTSDFNASHCNRKLIGARKFSQGMRQQRIKINATVDYDSPRDFLGHGTHTSSTAAGSRVDNVDYFGYARGTASGVAPMARLAMYKVLFYTDDQDSVKGYDAAATDVLAGMDQAIEDGVDVMSLSLGFFETPFYQNPIAVGAFAAIRRGIFVVCSAGNGGPHGYTVLNGAPWVTAVGAGTIDRNLGAKITLGGDNLITVFGHSLYPENLYLNRVPLYFGRGNRTKETCEDLDLKEAAGKFVFCDHDENGVGGLGLSDDEVIALAGVIISTNDGEFYEHASDFETPTVLVSTKDGDYIKSYILNSTINSTVVTVEFGSTVLGTKPAPKVAYFSSRGPDLRSPWVLKPDVLAPGYDIIAAWVPNKPFAPIRGGDEFLQTDYAIISGTSMSCPHVAGIAALLTSAARKDWSVAMIRSAMMTTADITDNAGGTILDMTTGVAGTPLDFGSGHVNPNRAMDPGLVYDVAVKDYVNYLCAMNYTKTEIAIITGESPRFITCEFPTLDLNYPSFSVVMNNTNTSTVVFQRVVTNVAANASVYHANLVVPGGMKAVVEPSTISFGRRFSTAAFNLTVEVDLSGVGSVDDIGIKSDYIGNYGYLSWVEDNGKHIVRSPIVSVIASPRT